MYDVGSSHPGAVAGPKGWAVRPLKWHASWVQNVVRQWTYALSINLAICWKAWPVSHTTDITDDNTFGYNSFIGENVMGAGNQQGRPEENLANYITGFVDGEGSFHVAVQRNPTVKCGWQIVPEFHVSQHESNRHVLELIRDTLGCGYVKPNHRKNLRDVTWVYVVKAHHDLIGRVLPFFQQHPLRTSKQSDFEKFATIVVAMDKGQHRSREGLRELLRIAFSMNRTGKYRKISLEKILKDLEPSETVRQMSSCEDKDTVRTA